MLTTEVWDEALTVVDPTHDVPRDAAPQVYVRLPAATDGPPAGEKSDAAWIVMDALPLGVVRTS